MTRQVLSFDERVGVRLLGNIQTRGRQGVAPYLMRTNAAGYRTRELSSPRPAGKRRVLVYGDSFTEGVGVSDGHRFTDVLEALPGEWTGLTARAGTGFWLAARRA